MPSGVDEKTEAQAAALPARDDTSQGSPRRSSRVGRAWYEAPVRRSPPSGPRGGRGAAAPAGRGAPKPRRNDGPSPTQGGAERRERGDRSATSKGGPRGADRGAPKRGAGRAEGAASTSGTRGTPRGAGRAEGAAPSSHARKPKRSRSSSGERDAGPKIPKGMPKPKVHAHGPRPGPRSPALRGSETTSPRVPIRAGRPLPGAWLWLTRAGAEGDLASELRLALGAAAKVREVGPGLLRSELAPTFEDGTLDATFARHGVRVRSEAAFDAHEVARRVAALATDGPIAFDVIVPDSDEGNRLAPWSVELDEQVRELIESRGIPLVARDRAREHGARLIDVIALSREKVAIGELDAQLALTLHPQGRARMKVTGDRPSRAARKVEEALDWLGLGPGPGETCVDLGAAPGGWSWALLERRARVIAVDPAELRPDVARHPRMKHFKASAFQFAPEETVDWLFCDMAWRPREAAQMLAKWARRGWARTLVANLKLPMKTKADMVRELREILHGGGWKRVRTRQLYHDRDEITVTAHR